MINFLDPIPTWLIMLVSAVLIFAMSEVGFQLARRKGPNPNGSDPSSLVQTTAFTLLALLLAFSFSLALGRYDARRGALLREANAISTTFLRSELLDARTASTVRSDLRAHIAQRIAYARADAQPDQRRLADQNSTKIQRGMWTLQCRQHTGIRIRRRRRSSLQP